MLALLLIDYHAQFYRSHYIHLALVLINVVALSHIRLRRRRSIASHCFVPAIRRHDLEAYQPEARRRMGGPVTIIQNGLERDFGRCLPAREGLRNSKIAGTHRY